MVGGTNRVNLIYRIGYTDDIRAEKVKGLVRQPREQQHLGAAMPLRKLEGAGVTKGQKPEPSDVSKKPGKKSCLVAAGTQTK